MNEVHPVDLVYNEGQTSFESPIIIAPSGEKNLQQPIVDVFTSAETKIKDEKNNNQQLAVEAVGMEVTVDEPPLTAAVVQDLKGNQSNGLKWTFSIFIPQETNI